MEMDGHDWNDIYTTVNRARGVRGKPVMILAHTVKARQCALVENKPESHNIKVENAAIYQQYMASLKYTDYRLPY